MSAIIINYFVVHQLNFVEMYFTIFLALREITSVVKANQLLEN